MGEERPDSHDTISVVGAGLPPRDCQENNDKNNIIIPALSYLSYNNEYPDLVRLTRNSPDKTLT